MTAPNAAPPSAAYRCHTCGSWVSVQQTAHKTTADTGNTSEAKVLRIWRECGLPEYFIGNGGTNGKLVEFAERAAEAEIQELKRQLAEALGCIDTAELNATKAWTENDRLSRELNEAKAAASGLPAAIETLRLERDRLSQVNGKLVMALRVIVSSCLHHPEIHLTLKLALANAESVLADAQKERANLETNSPHTSLAVEL